MKQKATEEYGVKKQNTYHLPLRENRTGKD